MLREVGSSLCYDLVSLSLHFSSSKFPDFPNQKGFIACKDITPTKWQRKLEILVSTTITAFAVAMCRSGEYADDTLLEKALMEP